MHYKNGREAHNGDTVIGKLAYNNTALVGIILDINPGTLSCNATLLRPAGMIQTCVTVGDFYHVDDALDALAAKAVAPAAPSTCQIPPTTNPA